MSHKDTLTSSEPDTRGNIALLYCSILSRLAKVLPPEVPFNPYFCDSLKQLILTKLLLQSRLCNSVTQAGHVNIL